MAINKRIDSRVYKIQKGAVFFDPIKYDFASAIFDKNIINTFVKSGLHDVAKIIQKELADRNLLDSLFIEMNIIGTLLEEKNPNMLNSLVYIREGLKQNEEESSTPHFAENVQKYSNAIIKELYKKFGYTIFYHPDVFIDQKEPQVPYSVIEPHVGSKAKLHLVEELEEERKQRELQYHNLGLFEMDFDTNNSGSEPWVGGKAKIVVGNSQFKRDYEDIIDTAKSIREKRVDVKNAIHQFHRYYHSYFARKHRTVYMAIPIQGAYAGNRLNSEKVPGIQGQGVIFLFFTIPPHSRIYDPRYDEGGQKLIEAIESLSECLFDRLGSLIRLLTYNYLFNLGINLAENVKRQAVKSAVSAIMSRNMSHNLGSHYLYYTKDYLETLANISGEKGPDIRGAAKVLSYMQARMDYLATVISNDRYPNGAVNFKSQIYDELTIDDFSKRHFSKYNDRGKRTTNFLLSNIVMSENFTRSNILRKNVTLDHEKVGEHFKPIRLQVKLWDGTEYKLFTGVSGKKTLRKEKEIKNELSKLNIALPGGTMSCHAFFNILENFIRNSAKYLQSDFKEDGLIFTIAIKRNASDAKLFDFIIFDNKNNAKKVLSVVNGQLQNLKILDEYGGVEKSSKGLKEMLFSSVWMRTYKYPLLNFADIISMINNKGNGVDKQKIIEEYGFKFVSVSDDGEILAPQSDNGNLGLLLSLPEFKIATNFVIKKSDTEKEIIANSLNISSDIVCFDNTINNLSEGSDQVISYFTRPYFENDDNEEEFINFCTKSRIISEDNQIARQVYRYKKILDKRFKVETNGNIDNVCLCLGDRQDMKRLPKDHRMIAYFERHLNTKKGFDEFMDYAYVDSISGGNFTITLNSLIDEGITADTCRYKTWYDKLLGLKIKESALTRITLIDERLFNSMKGDGQKKETEYALKNIRVLNVNLEEKTPRKKDLIDLFEGNAFQDSLNHTHFLSIHLGLIEKIIKSEWGKKYGGTVSIDKRVSLFMKELTEIFSGDSGEVYVSVHSGRGNFSKELEGPLATYPFISLAAIENAFSNSKYLLAQLFYNTIYIGKGIINKQ